MQATDITIKDGTPTTPVDVLFGLDSAQPGLVMFSNKGSGIFERYQRLIARFSMPSKSRKTLKASFDVSTPVAGTLPSGATGVIRTLRCGVWVDWPQDSTEQERMHAFAYLKNSMAVASVVAHLRDNNQLT